MAVQVRHQDGPSPFPTLSIDAHCHGVYVTTRPAFKMNTGHFGLLGCFNDFFMLLGQQTLEEDYIAAKKKKRSK